MNLIAVDNVYAGYGGAEILHGVSLTLADREIVTIIGPNGAGKSTLLKVVMGYLRPREGTVSLHGEIENAFPSLTVTENLRMGAYTLPRAQVVARIDAMFETFPILRDRRKQRAGTLSGGQRQLLAIARALMTDPEVLLLDEPSAALSPQMAEEVFAKVKEINQTGKAILLVEQQAQRSLEISDRGYVLVDGRNAYEGAARTILDDERIRTAFLGSTEPAA